MRKGLPTAIVVVPFAVVARTIIVVPTAVAIVPLSAVVMIRTMTSGEALLADDNHIAVRISPTVLPLNFFEDGLAEAFLVELRMLVTEAKLQAKASAALLHTA